ncbi:hypothetical protein A2769_01680 [Candidatus Daviesbacteria bacterium RIFCSPHIGHO2_01_FULL_37_27]|nr:MAG: hypothetical protein A2769_01680 [Candidatus Daviesbacteria bacterium RIFCSPHIGHO2_01_FULL_37_27]
MDPNNPDPNKITPQPDLNSIPSSAPQTPDLSSTPPPPPPSAADLPAIPTPTETTPPVPTISPDASSFSAPTQLPDLTSATQSPMSEPASIAPFPGNPQNELTTSTLTGNTAAGTSMPPPDTSFQSDPGVMPNQNPFGGAPESATADLIPTPTFTPPPSPAETGSTENPANASDFSTPTSSFNWSDNQNAAGTLSNDPFNFSNPSESNPAEPAPSDLSHLVNASEGMNPPGQDSAPTLAQPETLTPGAVTSNDVPNVPTEENHKSFPKWIIGVGVGLLLAVAGASAYFILGIGKTSLQGSIPAAEDNVQATIAPPIIQPTLVPTIAIPTVTPSAGVSLPGGSGTQATSAADLLRQRQGR